MIVRTVVAETLGRGANLGIVANVATLVASTTRERRHFDNVLCSGQENEVSRCARNLRNPHLYAIRFRKYPYVMPS